MGAVGKTGLINGLGRVLAGTPSIKDSTGLRPPLDQVVRGTTPGLHGNLAHRTDPLGMARLLGGRPVANTNGGRAVTTPALRTISDVLSAAADPNISMAELKAHKPAITLGAFNPAA